MFERTLTGHCESVLMQCAPGQVLVSQPNLEDCGAGTAAAPTRAPFRTKDAPAKRLKTRELADFAPVRVRLVSHVYAAANASGVSA